MLDTKAIFGPEGLLAQKFSAYEYRPEQVAMFEGICQAIDQNRHLVVEAGTGIGKTLRLQSEQLRNERFNRAEKAASEAPVKMLLPLVVFIFPTIWIILAAPLVFEWMYRGAP